MDTLKVLYKTIRPITKHLQWDWTLWVPSGLRSGILHAFLCHRLHVLFIPCKGIFPQYNSITIRHSALKSFQDHPGHICFRLQSATQGNVRKAQPVIATMLDEWRTSNIPSSFHCREWKSDWLLWMTEVYTFNVHHHTAWMKKYVDNINNKLYII